MGLKRKMILDEQKARLEQALKNRLSYLSGKGLAAGKADKDTLIRKLKGDIRAVNNRLAKIASDEKRTEGLKKAKAEKAAAPKAKAEGAKAGKAEKAEKPKKGAEEGKDKKPKPEKKPAGQEGKPAPKKKAEEPAEKAAEKPAE